MRDDRILSAGGVVLQVGKWINLLCGVGFVLAFLMSLAFAPQVTARLAIKYPALDVAPIVTGVRGALVVGMLASILAHIMLTRMLAIVGTVREGDPFVMANARRLQAIGWALLAWQVLDLVHGGLTAWIARTGADYLGWSPGFGGWIIAVIVFVLARVFAHGARMRDDLAMTV